MNVWSWLYCCVLFLNQFFCINVVFTHSYFGMSIHPYIFVMINLKYLFSMLSFCDSILYIVDRKNVFNHYILILGNVVLQNVMNATKVLWNPEIPEVASFRAGYCSQQGLFFVGEIMDFGFNYCFFYDFD